MLIRNFVEGSFAPSIFVFFAVETFHDIKAKQDGMLTMIRGYRLKIY